MSGADSEIPLPGKLFGLISCVGRRFVLQRGGLPATGGASRLRLVLKGLEAAALGRPELLEMKRCSWPTALQLWSPGACVCAGVGGKTLTLVYACKPVNVPDHAV